MPRYNDEFRRREWNRRYAYHPPVEYTGGVFGPEFPGADTYWSGHYLDPRTRSYRPQTLGPRYDRQFGDRLQQGWYSPPRRPLRRPRDRGGPPAFARGYDSDW